MVTPPPAAALETLPDIAREQTHENFDLLLATSRAGIPAYLHGEAGSGKTFGAEQVASVLGLEFRSISCCSTTSKSDLLGYRDAVGEYRGSAFRHIYENGGVFLIDEIDNSNPNTLAVVNNALANNSAEFPDGRVEKHRDTKIVAAANTIGKGASAQYVGRMAIDAATLDRFVFLPWDIDEGLEESMLFGPVESMSPTILGKIRQRLGAGPRELQIDEGGKVSDVKWLSMVRKYRTAANELGVRHIISPRATVYGAKLASMGVGKYWLKEMCIFKGMDEATKEKLKAFNS